PLTDAQAQSLLIDKRRKAKPVAKKILTYLNATAAFMLANGDVIYYQQGYYQRYLADFKQYFTDSYDFSVASLGSIDAACRRLEKAGWSQSTEVPGAATIEGSDGKLYDPYFCIRKILI
nr:hypothetical protein [Tanacetum cinerariifolium]